MFERIKGKAKVNITIDETLLEELNKLKDRENIPSLSPMINEMLWDWLKSQEKKQK